MIDPGLSCLAMFVGHNLSCSPVSSPHIAQASQEIRQMKPVHNDYNIHFKARVRNYWEILTIPLNEKFDWFENILRDE